MKKMILAIAAVITMSANVMAQDDQQQQGPQPRQFDRAEMMKQRTEQVVKDYGLNEEQAQKLLELNNQFAEKLPMMMMGRGAMGGPRGQRPQAGQQRRERPQQADTARRGQMRGERGNRPMMSREEMMKNMEAYNSELEKIMTPEQFAKYKDDMQKRMQQGMRGRGGNRPQRNNN